MITLRVGLADFDEPLLLLIGDATAFRWLADSFASGQTLDFAMLPFVEIMNVGLQIEAGQHGHLRRRATTFSWRISPTESPAYVQQLRNLAASDEPAHTYLDTACNTAGVEVMASINEYKDLAIYLPRLPSGEQT